MVENADLIRVDNDLVMVQNLSVEVHIVTGTQDDMFLFSLKEQMLSYQWTWTGNLQATSCLSTDNVAVLFPRSFLFTFHGISFCSFDQSSSIQCLAKLSYYLNSAPGLWPLKRCKNGFFKQNYLSSQVRLKINTYNIVGTGMKITTTTL